MCRVACRHLLYLCLDDLLVACEGDTKCVAFRDKLLKDSRSNRHTATSNLAYGFVQSNRAIQGSAPANYGVSAKQACFDTLAAGKSYDERYDATCRKIDMLN